MTKTVAALYDRFDTAQRVVENLTEAGFDRHDISMVANDASGEYSNRMSGDRDIVINEDVSAGEGAGFGAVVGTLIGLGAALIPGIGPVIGAGPLAVALTAGIGAAAGAIMGGITAALIDMGVDEDDAGIYAEGVRRGGTLITITTNDEWAERAEQIMNRYNPVDLDTRSSLWRERGWSRFDESAAPYNREQIEQEQRAYSTFGTTSAGMGDRRERSGYSNFDATHAAADSARQGQEEYNAKAAGAVEGRPGVNTGAQQPEDAGTLYGAMTNAAVGATGDFENDTLPGEERHHESSGAVRESLRRDVEGGDVNNVEVDRNARVYPRTAGKQDTNPIDTNNLNR